jgi:hypothetical protein
LIGKKPSDATLGKEPQEAHCSEGKAKFKDLDGEAVAFAGSYFYIAGSHGCSRHSNKFRTSSFILARVQVDEQGRPGAVDTTYRLADVLSTASPVGPFFGKNLNGANGLNVEGIAVAGEQLIVGLRAPVIQERAFLLAIDLAHLFSRASPPPPSHARPIPIPLGRNVGVRDLAPLSEHRLLLLAGPAQEQEDVPYSFFLVDLRSPETTKYLATIRDVVEGGAPAKAEGVVVLDSAADSVRVLVVFDGAPGGGPREYRVPLR